MDLHIRDIFVECGCKHILDEANNFLVRSPSWRLNTVEKNLPQDILVGFLFRLRNADAAYQDAIARYTTLFCPYDHNTNFIIDPQQFVNVRHTNLFYPFLQIFSTFAQS